VSGGTTLFTIFRCRGLSRGHQAPLGPAGEKALGVGCWIRGIVKMIQLELTLLLIFYGSHAASEKATSDPGQTWL
jgi:hypothetical protein